MAFSRSRGLFESTRVLFLPTGDIVPNPGQPRARFSRESLEELAEQMGLSVQVILPKLIALELKGKIREISTHRYVKV